MPDPESFQSQNQNIEKELQKFRNSLDNSELFRSIISASPNAILLVQDDKYIYSNPVGLKFLGCNSENEIFNKPIFSTISTEYHNVLKERLTTINQVLPADPVTLKFIRPDKKDIYVEASFRPILFNGRISVLIIGRNITEEHLLKAELNRSRNLLANTEIAAKIGSYEINLQTGKAIWSKGLYRIFDWPDDKQIPTAAEYYAYVHSHDASKVESMFTDCVTAGKNFDLKYRIISYTKKIKWVHSKAEVVLKDESQRFLTGFFRDITHDIALENDIKQSQENLQLLFDSIQEGIAFNEAIYDKEGNIIDHRILQTNKNFDTNSEYKSENILGKLASEAYEMDRAYIQKWWEETKSKTFPVYTEMYRPSVDRWIYISTSKVVDNKFVTAFIDITERKKSEIKIRESEVKYRSLVDQAPMGVMLECEGEIIFANSYILNMLELHSAEEIISTKFESFIAESDKSMFCKVRADLLNQKGERSEMLRLQLLSRNQAPHYTEVYLKKLFLESDLCIQYVVNDVTEKTRLLGKAKRLSTSAIYLSRKVETFTEVEKELKKAIKNNNLNPRHFYRLLSIIHDERNLEQLWNVFQENFEVIHEDFFRKLVNVAPNLTQQELKHCAFIKMNFETKEIAQMFNVKPASIQTSRVRLKKKLQLTQKDDLYRYIARI